MTRDATDIILSKSNVLSAACSNVRLSPDSDRTADIAEGPSRARSAHRRTPRLCEEYEHGRLACSSASALKAFHGQALRRRAATYMQLAFRAAEDGLCI